MEKKSNLGLEIIYWGLLFVVINIFNRTFHWSGMGMFAICLMFLGIALGIWQIFREKKSGEKMSVVILNFFTKFFLLTGLVFSSNHWPGGGPMILLSLLLFFVSIGVSTCIAVYKERNERLYILLLFVILSYNVRNLFDNLTYIINQ